MTISSHGTPLQVVLLAELLDLRIDTLLNDRVAITHPLDFNPPVLSAKRGQEATEQVRWVLKSLEITKETSHLRMMRFRHEIDVLNKFARPSIPNLLYSGLAEETYLYLIYQKIEYPSVFFLNQSPEQNWSFANVLAFAKKLYEAARGLHADGLVHLDLKPANILYDVESSDLRIIDFGASMSRFLPGVCFPLYNYVGSPSYSPPEYLLLKSVDPTADLYAIGLVLREILTGTRALTFDTIDEARDFYDHYSLPPLSLEEVRYWGGTDGFGTDHAAPDELVALVQWVNNLTDRDKSVRLTPPFWDD